MNAAIKFIQLLHMSNNSMQIQVHMAKWSIGERVPRPLLSGQRGGTWPTHCVGLTGWGLGCKNCSPVADCKSSSTQSPPPHEPHLKYGKYLLMPLPIRYISINLGHLPAASCSNAWLRLSDVHPLGFSKSPYINKNKSNTRDDGGEGFLSVLRHTHEIYTIQKNTLVYSH